MIEHNFSGPECSEAIGFSGGQFEFMVETLHGTAGNRLFGTKPVQEELAMGAQHAGYLLHRFYARPHRLGAAVVQEFARPVRGNILPEELEAFFKEITSYSFEIEFQQIRQLGLLNIRKVLRPLEQTPARMFENVHPFGPQRAGILSPDLVYGLVHVHGDVKAIKHVDGLASFLGDNLQVRFPHVAADEAQSSRPFVAERSKEPQHGS